MDTCVQHTQRPVWDIFIRIFHWTLAASILFAWWSGEEGGNWMNLHMQAGYLVLSLIVFRIIWGFTGSPYARFKSFLVSPSATLTYFKQLLGGQAPHHVGHNPLGGWMVIALLTLGLIQAGSGLFTTDDIFTEGPLTAYVSGDIASALTTVHKATFNIILAAVALHLAGVVYHQRFKRERLVQGMLHGQKPVADEYAGPPAPAHRAMVAVIPAVAVFTVLNLL
ncbi:cytochrome b/b6 domain-containing protein [Marinobacterium litorale]|uniref:cytochrome b/b6 domain-containing protein n=1 Tax=Marinobacterium litorale TaxID=404770 RepID=UPI00041130B8|nr:cytochrome b/b6 domain-containing protein [Marinobacterium litorale]